MKLVKFVKNNAPYRVGEVAGFDDRMADLLVSRKVAIAVDAPKKEKKETIDRPKLKDVIAERDSNSGYITK